MNAPEFASLDWENEETVRPLIPTFATNIDSVLGATITKKSPLVVQLFGKLKARVELPEDKKFEASLGALENSSGLRREFLASKTRNLAAVNGMGKEALEAVRSFALKYCVSSKFRRSGLIPAVKRMEAEALAEALSFVRGKPVYLYWKKRV